MTTFQSIISKWPSCAELARDIDQPYERVRMWSYRKSIPAKYWASIVEAAKKRGYDIDQSALVSAASLPSEAAIA